MTRTFKHLGEEWEVIPTGAAHGVQVSRPNLWEMIFHSISTDKYRYGSCTNPDPQHVSDDELREALEEALSESTLKDLGDICLSPTQLQMKASLAGLLYKSQTHRISYQDVEAEWRLNVPSFGDVPHTRGPKAMLKSLSEDSEELAKSGIGFDAAKHEFWLLPLGLNDGYRADHGDKLHLVITQRVDDMLVRMFDKSKPSKGVGEKIWQGQCFELDEAKQLAVEFANRYLDSSGTPIPLELPNWQFYHDIGTELGGT